MVDPIALFLVGVPAAFAAAWLGLTMAGRGASEPFRDSIDTGPFEPCWTEAIESDGRYRYSRGQCVNDLLMELDARARRGDFPLPQLD